MQLPPRACAPSHHRTRIDSCQNPHRYLPSCGKSPHVDRRAQASSSSQLRFLLRSVQVLFQRIFRFIREQVEQVRAQAVHCCTCAGLPATRSDELSQRGKASANVISTPPRYIHSATDAGKQCKKWECSASREDWAESRIPARKRPRASVFTVVYAKIRYVRTDAAWKTSGPQNRLESISTFLISGRKHTVYICRASAQNVHRVVFAM